MFELLTPTREALLIISLVVAGMTWLYSRSRGVAQDVVLKEVTPLITANAGRIAAFEAELARHKSDAQNESRTLKARLDKIDQSLVSLSAADIQKTADLAHHFEYSKLEMQTLMASINRVEAALDQITKRSVRDN